MTRFELMLTYQTEQKLKKLEITGYVKIDPRINSRKGIVTDIDWIFRTDKYDEKPPCYGLSFYGGLYLDVSVYGKIKSGLPESIQKKKLYLR